MKTMPCSWTFVHRPLQVAVTAASIVLASSCTTSKSFLKLPSREYVWPPAPEPPRVRFLGEISGSMTGAQERSRWQEFLFGPQPQRHLITPSAVAVDDGGERVAITDPNGHCVHLLQITTNRSAAIYVAGQTDFEAPIGVAWGGNLLFVSDPPRRAVEIFEVRDMEVRHLRTLSGNFERPTGLTFLDPPGVLCVCDSALHKVFLVRPDGTVLRSIGEPGGERGKMRFPTHVAAEKNGLFAVSDSMNFRVQIYSAESDVVAMFGRKGDAAGDLALPKGIAFDHQGNIWVVDAQFENVQAFTPMGDLLLAFGGEGHGPGEFWLPAGAWIDSLQRLWIADTYNRRVQVFQLLP